MEAVYFIFLWGKMLWCTEKMETFPIVTLKKNAIISSASDRCGSKIMNNFHLSDRKDYQAT